MMGKWLAALLLMVTCAVPSISFAATKVKVAWCQRTLSIGAAPIAIATHMGWFKEAGIEVEIVPFGGSTECVQNLTRGEVDFSISTPEPLAIIRTRGVPAKIYYTILHRNIFGLAVPADSPIRSISDLKGKTIGVQSMASSGVQIAKAVVAANGMDPEKDFQFATVGEAAQTASLLRSKQVDALSQQVIMYGIIENAGIKLRMLDNSAIASFPSNGIVALEKTLVSRRAEAIALARGFAMGTLFANTNLTAAAKILREVYPESKLPNRDEASAIAFDKIIWDSLLFSMDISRIGVKRWGESDLKSYTEYLKFAKDTKIITADLAPGELITNDLLAEINKFDADLVKSLAEKAGKAN